MMTFNNSMKIMAIAASACLALFLGAYGWSVANELRQEKRTHTAFVQGRLREGVTLFQELSPDGKNRVSLRILAEEACEELGVPKSSLDGGTNWRRIGWGSAVFVALCLAVLVSFKKPKSLNPEVEPVKMATSAQVAMIRRLSHWQSTTGLTQEAASVLIKSLMDKAAEQNSSVQAFDPYRFMTPAEAKRARERIQRAEARDAKDKAREQAREARAEELLYKKREGEQEKLYKLRDEVVSGGKMRKATTEKARVIQDFQNLMIGILADNKIEPQEVRQIKAWLLEHSQYPDEFSAAIALFDEALSDGLISEEEQSCIFEAVLDCLVTLRARRQ